MTAEKKHVEPQARCGFLPKYPEVPMYALVLFGVYIVIWFLQVGNRISLLGAIRFEFLLSCFLIVVAISLHSNNNAKYNSKISVYVFFYFVLLFVMTLFSYDFNTSWVVFLNRIVKFAFMAYFIVSFVKSPFGMRFFLAAFMLACFKIGQEGLVGQLTGSMVWLNQGIMRLHGSTMLFRHPNSFSCFALSFLPFVICLYPIAGKWVRIFLLVQSVFAVNIILNTGSRTGYVAFIGLACLVIWRSKKRFKVSVLCILLAAITLTYAPTQYKNRFLSIFNSATTETVVLSTEDKSLHGGDGSKRARMLILQHALAILVEHPFGVGVSAFPSIRNDMFGLSQDTHNLYLEVATNLGIQGCLVWGMFIFAMFNNVLGVQKEIRVQIKGIKLLSVRSQELAKHSRLLNHLADLQLIDAVCNSVILFLAVRLFLGFFGHDLYEIWWWLVCGIAISVEGMARISKRRSDFFYESCKEAVRE